MASLALRSLSGLGQRCLECLLLVWHVRGFRWCSKEDPRGFLLYSALMSRLVSRSCVRRRARAISHVLIFSMWRRVPWCTSEIAALISTECAGTGTGPASTPMSSCSMERMRHCNRLFPGSSRRKACMFPLKWGVYRGTPRTLDKSSCLINKLFL